MPVNPQDGTDGWIPVGNAFDGATSQDGWIPTGNGGDDPYADGWVPVPAALSADAAPASGVPSSADAGSPNLFAGAFPNPPAPRPDPYAAYWAQVPASRLSAVAWDPPRFPDASGQYPLPAPPPRDIPLPMAGVFGGLAKLTGTTAAPATWTGILGGLDSRSTNKSWSLLGSLDDLAWSAPSFALGGSGYPNLDGSSAPGIASYAPRRPPLAPPDRIGDQESGSLPADPQNDLLYRAYPTGLAPNQLRTDQVPSVALGTGPEDANPKFLLVGGEGDDERKKFEAPAVTAGLIEPGRGSPKGFPLLPSIPPLDVPPTRQPPDGGAPLGGGRGVWDSPPTVRGRALEQLFGHNLHPNHPTVDIWDPDSGTATSLKSIDLDSPAYRVEGNTSNALYNRLSKCVNDLAEFQGSYYTNIYIPEEAIKSRVLTVIVPREGTAAEQEVMRRIAEQGTQRGLTVNFKIYP